MIEIIDDFLDAQYHQNILGGLKSIPYHKELNNIWYHPFYNSLLNREWRIISRYWDVVREEFVKTVGLTRYQIDLLLGAFAAAQSAIEHDRKQEAGSTIHSIINRWTECEFLFLPAQ